MINPAERDDYFAVAVEEVTALCVGNHPEGYGHNQPWDEVAETYPQLSDRIAALGTAIETARVLKLTSCPIDPETYRHPVYEAGVVWKRAVDLLSDILIARLSIEPGALDPNRDPDTEARAMVEEISAQPGGPDLANLKIYDVVRAVLEGRLAVE